ncbi:multisubunit potassium/proton antiporter, PhaE subunit [Devosia lucknowensis]|uniref:Multisubunit potassium/proton antiporter, PhaE subunit n=1 Tax=Devosia lucknowensis TaxID=1096929 RepID=A0A1Y6EUU0_9HYPH|nr:Na+/H+ antiporter subunit E [Devosia lucknowensis]SMQ63963.1 multisubunit potassium/proton antiporter, PhaE subunit [Devosia lucknowensis]
MTRIFPFPLLTIGLTLVWLLLQQSFGLGHILFGFVVAFFASHAMARLQPHKPRIRRPDLILRLLVEVTIDILRSNLAVARIVMAGERRKTTAAFIKMPLELRDPMGLAVLSCIITATPGSAWLEYSPAENTVLIHVLDLIDEKEWIDTIKRRYETQLLEIFR